MQVLSVHDAAFCRYGKVPDGYEASELSCANIDIAG